MNVTIQTSWKGYTVSFSTTSPLAPAGLQGGWRNPLQEQEHSPRAGRHLTRSTWLDFQRVLRSLNCLNMPLRLTMMMAAKMA